MNITAYSLKSFRQNMSKGIIFMIALAVTLMSTVLNLATSFQETIYRETVAASTNAHAQYNYITEEQAQIMSSDDSLLWSSQRLFLWAWGTLPGRDDGIQLVYEEQLGIIEGLEIESGRAPEAENEVALPPHTLHALGLELELGDTFTLTVENMEGDITQYDLVVTGILCEMKTYEAINAEMIFFSRAFMDAHGAFPDEYGEEAAGFLDIRSLLVHFKDDSSVAVIKDQGRALAQLAGIDEKYISYNESYIGMNVLSPDILSMIVIILIILLATGAIVIYNAFNMVIVKRIRQYGMLILIGASKRQVRSCVYLEALLSAAVALPLGLLLGTGLSYCSLPLISDILGSWGVDMYFKASVWSYILVSVLALVMVWIGVTRPARKAAKTTPVEAVKLSPASEKTHRRKGQQNVTVAALAKLNMTRNRSRTISTVLTLTISGILLLSLSTLCLSLYASIDGMIEDQFADDIMIHTGIVNGHFVISPKQNQLSDDVLQSIGQIDGVQNTSAFYSQEYFTAYTEDIEEFMMLETGNVISMDWNTLSGLLDLVIDGNPTEEDFAAANVINVIAVNQYSCDYAEPYTVELGDTITAYTVKNQSDFQVSENAVQLHVVGIIDLADIPGNIRFCMNSYGNLPSLLMLPEVYRRAGFIEKYDSAAITIDEEQYAGIAAALENVIEPYEEIYYESMADQKAERQREVGGALALVFLGIFIIVLIGMVNLACSVLIDIEQRKQEFGVLSALGLSRRGLRKLLGYESIRISVISVLFSSFLGIGTGYLLFHLIYRTGVDNMVYAFPLVPLVVMCTVYIAVPLLVTGIAVRRLRLSTTTELLGVF